MKLDYGALPSPCFVVDAALLRKNGALLAQVQERAGCKILLAQKGFAMWSAYPVLQPYLAGTTGSSANEVRLGKEVFGGETHAYVVAYSDAEFERILPLADHIVFNSPGQWRRFRERATGKSCGLRINPEHREVATELYDPCAPMSRLGTTRAQIEDGDLEGLDGLHFHTLCELDSDALERTLVAFEEKFGEFIPRMKWINFGGGHHITRPGYDIERLVRIVKAFREKWGVAVYLEPGEAAALNTGVLVSTVLDILDNGMQLAILDTSATAHMPDVLEMPYRPNIVGAGTAGEFPHTYRLGGQSCLAGDIIGDYSFPEPLTVGDKLVFLDMAHYSMVKTTFFNGVQHPAIALHDSETGETRVVREFTYEDYKARLS